MSKEKNTQEKTSLPRGLSEKNGRYRIRFTSKHTAPGQRYQERLLPETTEEEAREQLLYLKMQDRRGELIFLSKQVRVSEQQPEPQPEMPSVLEYAIKTYLPFCEAENTQRTVELKRYVLEQVSPWFGDIPLDQVNTKLVRHYQAERKAEGVKSRTVNLGWQIVRALLYHAHEEELIETPPPRVKQLTERDRKPVVWFSPEEGVQALEYAHTRSEMWYTLTLFLLHTGARWGETRKLEWRDLKLREGIVSFRAETAKQGQPRELPLVPELLEALQSLDQIGKFVFMRPRQHTKEPIPLHQSARCIGGKYPWEGPNGELHQGPHTFRHTFASWKLRAGVPMAIVKEFLGHADITTTVNRYGHIRPEECSEEISRGPRPQIKGSQEPTPAKENWSKIGPEPEIGEDYIQ